MRIDYWDVGQGDCSVIALPNKELIIIDVGPLSSPIVEWLKGQRPSIHSIILTHNDEDHVGALTSILETDITIRNVYFLANDRNKKDKCFKEMFTPLYKEHIRNRLVIRSLLVDSLTSIIWQDEIHKLEILHPDLAEMIDAPTPNNASAIISLKRDNNIVFLWGGDAPYSTITAKCLNDEFLLLMGPHHGAPIDKKKSKYLRDILKLHPKYNFLSFQSQNRYGHPDSGYIKHQSRKGCNVYCGEMCLRGKESLIVPERYGHIGICSEKSISCRGGMFFTLDENHEWQIDDLESEYIPKRNNIHRRLCKNT